MALKNFEQLSYAIDQAVHTDGPLGKTNAPSLNTLLKTLASEITALPQALSAGGIKALTYAEAQDQQVAGTWQPGAFYFIGQRPDSILGSSGEVLVQATATDSLAPEGILCTRVPDYTHVPLWRLDYMSPATPTGTTSYTQTTASYEAVVPRFLDAIDRHVSGNDNVVPLELPFPFTYGGVTYTAGAIDTNGRLLLGAGPFTTSYQQQRMGTTDAPVIAFAWQDMTLTPATFRSFVTGNAPRRRLVLEYQHAPREERYQFDGIDYNVSDVMSGQVVLEESTNCITIGMFSNLNPDTDVVQGIQYEGHGYNLYEGQMLPSGVMTTFTPVTGHSEPAPVVVPSDQMVIWKGCTWILASGADSTVEPGTDSAWSLVTGAGRDDFGNAIPAYDRVTYDFATDTISTRADKVGNVVRRPATGGLGAFPWGCPGVVGNVLDVASLDTSLLTTPNLQFAYNQLYDVSFTRVNLAGVTCTHNALHGVSLTDYAPTQFDHVTAYFGFDQAITAASRQVFVKGVAVQSAIDVIETGFATFKDHYVDARFTTYRAGQAPSYEPLDLLNTTNTDFTPHDLIVLRGSFGTTLCLRNQDYRVSGPATFERAFFGAVTRGLNLWVSALTFTDVMYLLCASVGNKGHRIRVENCSLTDLQYYGGGNGQLNTYAFAQCTIRRLRNLDGQPYQQVSFEGCTFGVGLTEGSVFGGGRGASNGALVIANSLVLLQGTATLFDAGLDQQYAPTFYNVTVLAADGTVSCLNNQTATVSQSYAIQDDALVVSAVTGGNYVNGELQSDSASYATATGSPVLAGDRIVSTNYVHEYCRLTSGTLGWVRWAKG